MRYEIVLAPGAVRELTALTAYHRAKVRDAIERHLRHEPAKVSKSRIKRLRGHLRHEPAKVSKSRIKRLRGLSRPQFRLRVDDTRVFYDVTDKAVAVLAIISKAQAEAW